MSKVKTMVPDSSARSTDLVEALASGKLRFHEIPADVPGEEAAAIRRAALERITGVALDTIGDYAFDARAAAKRNCENLIGAAQIPMGIVGPLAVRGSEVDGDGNGAVITESREG